MLNHIKTKINSYICLEFNSKQKVEFKNLKFDLGIFGVRIKQIKSVIIAKTSSHLKRVFIGEHLGLMMIIILVFLEQCSIMGYDMVFKETDDSYRWNKLCKDLNLNQLT